jgi:hypothetical protein
MRVLLFVLFFYISNLVSAQYWFGPKVGINTSNFKYQSPGYAQDTFLIKPSMNFELGGVAIYQASRRFSVQSEVYFEQIKKTLTDRPLFNEPVSSQTTNRFISIPMLFRVSFGREPVTFYASGGIKLRYWIGGKGEISSVGSEFDTPISYDKIVFRQSKSNVSDGIYAVPQANIMQFGLAVGGGMYFDLRSNGRLIIDAKYTFGHSNMGFNNNPDFKGNFNYSERFSYRNNTLSLSLAYLFKYNSKDQKKGASTSTQTKEAKKK